MRTLARIVTVAASLALASACLPGAEPPGESDREVDSESHFLTICTTDDECPGAMACICEICTVTCADDAACGDLAPDATCLDVTASPGAEFCGTSAPAADICGVMCDAATPCGDGASCGDGLCVGPPAGTPRLTVHPAPVDFGVVRVGHQATREVALLSQGAKLIEITDVAWLDDAGGVFALETGGLGTLPVALRPGASASVAVTFDPVDASFSQGALRITSNGETPAVDVVVRGDAGP